jgi:hypothetical protein
MNHLTVPLAGGHVLLIDAEDWTQFCKYTWQALQAPNGNTFYARGKVAGKPEYLHRLLMDAPADKDVDHRNGEGLDNRRGNLRLCTESQNLGNSRIRVDNTSGYKGVHRFCGRWRARIALNGKRRSLGMFADPWEAAQAYNRAALEQWGEFALLNERIT